MKQKQIERQALIVSVFANLIFTISGVWIFATTGIQALFLDCFFSFIAFMSSVVACVISKVSSRKTKYYPHGLHFMEPLYAIFKSLLTLILLIVSVIGTGKASWNYFAYGIGEPMNIGSVFPYTIAMVVMCFSLGLFNRARNRKLNDASTMLLAESKTNFIDGLQSMGIGIAVVLLGLTDINGSLGFLHYTGDFFVTVVLVIASLKEPLRVLNTAFRELSGGLTDDMRVNDTVQEIVAKHLKEFYQLQKCEVYKTGMYLRVLVHISGDIEFEKISIIRKKILKEIGSVYENVQLTFYQ